MTAFRYRAARLDGELLAGTVEAGSPAAALQAVEARGLFLVELAEDGQMGKRAGGQSVDLGATLAGLAALLEAGLPVDRALMAAEETASPKLQTLLAHARERVREGASLSSALDAAGAISPLVLGYLKAGEKTGRLAQAVARAAEELERVAETRARIRAALTYPAFLALAGAASVTAIVGYVVPRFAGILGAEGRALPAATRLLIGASELVGNLALPGVAIAAVATVAAARAVRTRSGQLALHRRLLALPLLGALRLKLATARACAALASLIDASVPMLAALELAQGAAADRAVGERIAAARLEVDRGERLASALRRHEALSPAALQLVAFGERSGRLALFLQQAARLEAAATQRAIQRFVTLLEPVLILGFGAVVAFVAAALLQAVYSVRPGL